MEAFLNPETFQAAVAAAALATEVSQEEWLANAVGAQAAAAAGPQAAGRDLEAAMAETAVAETEDMVVEPTAAEAPAGQSEPSVEELLQQYLRRLRRVERVVFPSLSHQASRRAFQERLEASFADLRAAHVRQRREFREQVRHLQDAVALVQRQQGVVEGGVDLAAATWQRRWDGFGLHERIVVLRLNALERRVFGPAVAAVVATDEDLASLARAGSNNWPVEWGPPPVHQIF